LFAKPKYYKDCSELPAGIFFKILETQDVSLLCYKGKKKHLEPIWEGIVQEYEQLTASNDYSKYLTKTNSDCIKINRLNSLIGLYWLKHLNPDGDYSQLENYWGVVGLTKEQIRIKVLQERTKFDIDLLKREAQKNQKVEDKKQTVEDIKIMLEENLNKDYIDMMKVSVKEWVAMIKRVIEKHNGRKDKGN
jgi:hypothetical protein